MNNKTLMANLRCIPDFPQKGINFRDVTTLFKNPACLQIMVDELYEMYKNKGKDVEVSIGKPIPWQTFDKSHTTNEWAQYVRDNVYKL